MVIRVIKIGGSLLLRPNLLADLRQWREQNEQPGDTTIAIIGGGQMIDAVRSWDRLRPGDSSRVHWRCVEMLRHSFDCLRDALEVDPAWTNWQSIETSIAWQAWLDRPGGGRFVLLNVPAFYHAQASRRSKFPLPEDWRTTTDAIAIWLASEISTSIHRSHGVDADKVECVLLKSCEIPSRWTVSSLVESGIIDAACGELEQAIPSLRVCRLSPSNFPTSMNQPPR